MPCLLHREGGCPALSVDLDQLSHELRVFFFRASSRASLGPLPWTSFFTKELFLERSLPGDDIVHHLYITPPEPGGSLFVTHHGAGSSGLSFAALALQIRRLLPKAGVLSVDARGHGQTVVKPVLMPSSPLNLSLTTLSEDLIAVICLVQRALNWSRLPGMVLVGHSLGGAVVTEVARSGNLGDQLLGYAVLDVVEGKSFAFISGAATERMSQAPPWMLFSACRHICRHALRVFQV